MVGIHSGRPATPSVSYIKRSSTKGITVQGRIFWNPMSPTRRRRCDTAIQSPANAQVDYFSYRWNDEDLWSSRRFISTREQEDAPRLDNVLWRAWAQQRYMLKLIPPSDLDWLVLVYLSLLMVAKGCSQGQGGESDLTLRALPDCCTRTILQKHAGEAQCFQRSQADIEEEDARRKTFLA